MRYGTTDVLRGIDFDIRTGEVAALLGPNGAGKTTTIEILEGFRARSAGQVTVLGVIGMGSALSGMIGVTALLATIPLASRSATWSAASTVRASTWHCGSRRTSRCRSRSSFSTE